MKKISFVAIILISVIIFDTDSLTADAVMTINISYPFSTGVSSFYSYECADLPMANGKPFDPEKRTCASWFYKFGTVLAVK
ncbi:MAG: hypothetical protein Q8R48_00960, partial [Candidatus Omnitrophota bacterium]|nr:hypothetical protein [Candidatus Omnitrophota bacterium]